MPPKKREVGLEELVKLQAIQMQMRTLQESIKAIPQQVEMITADTRRFEEEIRQCRKLEQSLDSQYRSYENEIQDRNTKLDRYQMQLLEVKTNIEYAALLKQIDTIKRMNEETNEKIFHLEEEREQLVQQRVEKENVYRRAKAENDKKINEKQFELDQALGDMGKLEQKETRIRSKISPELLSKYSRIAEARDGIAVVSANDGICKGCYTSIRPQVFDEIRRGGSIVQCESCSRILFFDSEQETGRSS